jgi:uncharacterized protein with PQ loop repeat
MINFFGWLGAFCFAICAAPQAWHSIQQKHSDGVSWVFLILWLIGELSMIVYATALVNWILLTNYVFNLIMLVVIIYYKVKGKNNGKTKCCGNC